MTGDNSKSLKEDGRNQMIQGNYEEASKIFREYLNTERDDIEARYLYTATKELKKPININVNFITVVGLDIYLHMGVTAPLGSNLIEVLNKVTEVCKETEERIANRFRVSEDGNPIGEGFSLNWHVLDFKTVKVDMINKTTEPERMFLQDIESEQHRRLFSVPPKGFLEYQPTDFKVQFKTSFAESPLDKVEYTPQDTLTSVLGQYNTIVLLSPNVGKSWLDVASLLPTVVPELDIFFKQKRNTTGLLVDALIDSGMPKDMSREDVAKLAEMIMAQKREEKKEERKVESHPKDHCPDCNAKISEVDIRPDGYVICKRCRKRFKP